MPNYRSLTGGFFSSTPMDKSTGPVTIRMNNPGAINGAAWEKTYPGFVGTMVTTAGNPSTIFETPEYGVGAWWELMRKYRSAGATTVGGIITRYGGGQDYSAYVQTVAKMTGFTQDTPIDIDNDQQILKFGKAMFRYEAGRQLPWSDDQILCGIQGGREFARTGSWPATPTTATNVASANVGGPVSTGPAPAHHDDLLPLLQKLLIALASKPPATSVQAPVVPPATTGATAPVPQPLSTIDKIFGGEALTGSKTMIGVLGYVLVTVLKAAGVLGAATPAGQILTVVSIAFSVLGALAKVDRTALSLSAIAAKDTPAKT
jgi:hypothetical protein